MVKRNPNIAKLKSGYLFPEINRRKAELLKRVPDAKIISLGIGNTTEHLTKHIAAGLRKGVDNLSKNETYTGYGDEQGLTELRHKIAEVFYPGLVTGEEVFISDGAKCDCGRLQIMFGSQVKIAVQDPAYPVYVDGSVIAGATGAFDHGINGFSGINYMPCTPDNNFFPDFSNTEPADLLYICSPNNPTGAVANRKQLEQLVEFAAENGSIIIFDAAYAQYIQDDSLPKSIYEINGARKVAIEVNSFSKPIGFTGVRLGWTVIPKDLKFDDGESVHADWNRITTTIFNGASNVVQAGGLAALDPNGLVEMRETIAYYMENARLIVEALSKLGIKTFGGNNSPYVWASFPGRKSWDLFSAILEHCHILCTPGAGFGPAGEGFARFSAFGHRPNIIEALKRLSENSEWRKSES